MISGWRSCMKRNAFFQLIQRNGKMYLKSYPAINGGRILHIEDVIFYLDKKKINDVAVDDIKKFVTLAGKQKNAEMLISNEEMIAENESLFITVDPKRLYAKVRLYPPSNKGLRLETEDIISLLEQQGVVHGILYENIALMQRLKLYCTDILVAKATMPVHGHDAQIHYNFNLDKTNKPAMDENGHVDFHRLDMIEPVEEGQLLATLEPADFGIPGIDITGQEIKPKTVKVLSLKHGKNIHLSEDELEMYSEVSGNVTCVDDTVFVSDCYEVPADVGPSTGDLEYSGSVNIKGNVLSGYTVKASGDIYVNGAVEGATLISGGKIVLNRGIQGKGKGMMQAEGDIISNFIESSNAYAGGKIVTDAILHSQVVAQDSVIVNGKRGIVTGGSVRSTVLIETKVAGSTMGTVTELEVGIDPKVSERYHEIEDIIADHSDEKEKLEQTLTLLLKRVKAKGKLEEEKLEQLKQSKARLQEIEAEDKKLSDEYEALEEELRNAKDVGKIIVHDKAYSSVKITISNIVKYLHSEVQHSSFVRDGADIRIRGL